MKKQGKRVQFPIRAMQKPETPAAPPAPVIPGPIDLAVQARLTRSVMLLENLTLKAQNAQQVIDLARLQQDVIRQDLQAIERSLAVHGYQVVQTDGVWHYAPVEAASA